MINPRVVVDGSNIATEGRTLPSLEQLDEAVRAFLREFPDTEVTVVVDATFGHRIAESERPTYEEAVLAGELVSPPAGAIGRGDAFVLSIASRADATVFSNDSFQEFHGQYTWLFDEGRLIGGKPIPNVGWVFVLRSPVRGVASRRATQRASKANNAVEKSAPKKSSPKKSTPRGRGDRSSTAAEAPAQADEADATASASAAPEQARSGSGRDKRRRGGGRGGSGGGGGGGGGGGAPEPVNDPLAFLAFVSHHPVGAEVEGTVDRFSSHGAYVAVDGAQCYVPLRLMADPPPKSAKELLSVGDTRSFVVESFDSPRRSIDLAIPGLGSATTPGSAPEQTSPAEEAPSMAAPRKTAAKKKATAKRAPAKKKATAKKATARKATTKRAPAKKAAKKKAPAKKKAAAKRAPAKKKATAKRAPAKKKATARKAPAKKKTTTRRAPAKKR